MFSAIHLSFFPYCILGMRNRQISVRCITAMLLNFGHMQKVMGLQVQSLLYRHLSKKLAGTTYCGPPFFQELRYLDISQSKTMSLNAILIRLKFDL